MERCDGSEHGNAESYVIQGTDINPVLITTPPLEQFATMDSEGAPNFIYDQGIYYPATANYYGYYCTGFESPGDWNDHHRVFGLDGPDFQYAGVQSENIPYVYYTPTYGYAQSPYNPYNPYIPGAIIGIDGSVVGTQQYYPGSGYQHTASASAYYPLVAQPSLDNVLNSFQEPHSLNAGTSVNGQGLKDTEPSERHDVVGAELADNGTGQLRSGPSGSIPHSAPSHISQGKSVSGSTQGSDQFSFGSVSSSHANRINVAPVSNGLPNISTIGRGWSVDKHRSRLQYSGVSRDGNGNPDSLGEQNRGPRTNRSKSQWLSSASAEAHSTNVEATTLQGNIIIHTDQYNREDFPINYADAKFFVIKSYSEDDVHKSIKYNVWSSTPNGNKRLDSAYEDAQRIAAGKPRGIPVFLFFSVNASGQFCGVAEMVGPVDFDKDMDFWQQDKWSGSFPVKWHIIKDVPNTNFRHILLENNENKPVTNSRDTQEIKWKPGMEMLKIFKNYTLKTSILDDFKYYEERQRIMQEEKSRHLGKTYDASFFVPAFVPGLVPPLNGMSMQIDPNNSGKIATSSSVQVPPKSDEVNSSITQKDNVVNNVGRDANDETSILKIGSLAIQPKPAEANSSVTMSRSKAVDVVTVGSMPIKVNGSTGVSSEVLTIGTIPIIPKVKPDKPA